MTAAPSAVREAELQAHGVVVVLDRALRIAHVTSGCEALLGAPPDALLGGALKALLPADHAAELATDLAEGPETIGWRRVALAGGGAMRLHPFDAGGGHVGLDLLPLPAEQLGRGARAVERVAAWSARFVACERSAELLQVVATVVRELTGFQGAWVSHRDELGQSVLVAADVDQAPVVAASAAGQSVQARDALPDHPRVRGRPVPFFVADLAAGPATLVPAAPAEVDLSASLLLRPFPEFLDRMRTLGVRAVGAVPVLVDGEPWGRVVTMDPAARRVTPTTQAELGLLGVAAGARLRELMRTEEHLEREALARHGARVVQSLAATDDLLTGLARDAQALPGVCAATAAVVSIGGRSITVGDLGCGAAEQLLTVAREVLRRPGMEALVASTTLGGATPTDPSGAAGFLAVRLDPAAEDVIVWTRGEERRRVAWIDPKVAGAQEGDVRFDDIPERIEDERGSCAPWTPAQQHQAAELREAIGEVLLTRYSLVRDLNVELTRSNEEFDAFAHAAAHDLKAPLRGIRQNTEFFIEDVEGLVDPALVSQLDLVVRLTDRMGLMLDDLMAYARVGKSGWHPQPMDLEEAVAEVVELLGPRLDGATVEATPATFTMDPAALRQVLQNLIGNAAKYAGDAPARVTAGVIPLGEAARRSVLPELLADAPPHVPVLVVQDLGIGIAEHHHERIFELFRQVDPDAEGTGTGLALCRLICRRHGGDIWLSSTPGEGSTFFAVAGV